ESFARAITIRLGGVGHIAEYAMSGADVRRTAVPRTLSLALSLGRAIREARAGHRDPVTALADALAPTLYSELRVLFRGKGVDVVGISTPDLMRTPEALATFGPAAFGLDREFAPVELQGDDELVAPRA